MDRNLGKRIGSEGGHGGSQFRNPSAVGGLLSCCPRESGSPRAGRGTDGNGPFGASSPGIEQSTQNCALNVKVKKFNQARGKRRE
ncbi:hypothetical protein KIW84_UN0423 [Lathyrus oleraceus]|nr:hypothetical protein KIW84_UN0423 [Pisum sativum]